jgi:hypothetical protein
VSINPNVKLETAIIEDIKYGADSIRVGLREKYLGRNSGTKRG